MSDWYEKLKAETDNSPSYQAMYLSLLITGRIIERAQEQGIEIKDAAKDIGLSPKVIRLILDGDPQVSLLALARCASAVGMTLFDAVGLECNCRKTKHNEQ